MGKRGATEGFPFDESTLVFKVRGKIFAITGLERLPFSVNLKCEPERAVSLREMYQAVQPGYHMSKKHWNTVVLDGSISIPELHEMIDHSYERVVAGLNKSERVALENGND